VLRAERDELKSRLQAALDEIAVLKAEASGSTPSGDLPLELDALDESVALLPDSVPPPQLFIASSVPLPPSSELALAGAPLASSLEPLLSGVTVSTRPPADSDEPSNGADRRRRERQGCEFEVEFLDDTHLTTGLTQDVSEGGVFVATYQTLAIGTEVVLALQLPGHRVEVRGEVRWARPECENSDQRPGFGVAFTELTPEALVALTELCRSRPPHYYEM